MDKGSKHELHGKSARLKYASEVPDVSDHVAHVLATEDKVELEMADA